MQVDLDHLKKSAWALVRSGEAKIVLDARDEITRLRAALRVACKEITFTRAHFDEHTCGRCSIAMKRTDAAIDLATGEPKGNA